MSSLTLPKLPPPLELLMYGCYVAVCAVLCTGAEFEARILASEANNVKFNFLQPTDPYHAYYRMRVSARSFMLIEGDGSLWAREEGLCSRRVCGDSHDKE